MAEQDVREFVARALSYEHGIPRMLFEAIASHAVAVCSRQTSEDAVRDAEAHLAAARSSGVVSLIEGAQLGLDTARRNLRGDMFDERLKDGAVEAIRARIALIDATYRRTDVAAQLEKRNW